MNNPAAQQNNPDQEQQQEAPAERTREELGASIEQTLKQIMDSVYPGRGDVLGEQLFKDMRKYFSRNK